MIPILRNAASGRVWVVVILMVAALFFVPDGGVEGVDAPHGLRGGGAAANQSATEFVVHGPGTLSVYENTAIGEYIATYRVVTAGGADVSGTVFAFSLEGDDADKYAIDSRSGELFTAAWLDYETDTSDTIRVVASRGDERATLDVTVNIENVDDSVSTVSVSKANPVPGIGQGTPENALDDSPEGFVRTGSASWGTILRFEVSSESPDPDCGMGLDCVFISLESYKFGDGQQYVAMRSGERGIKYRMAVMLVEVETAGAETVEIVGSDGTVREVSLLQVR